VTALETFYRAGRTNSGGGQVAVGASNVAASRDIRGGQTLDLSPSLRLEEPQQVYALIRSFSTNHVRFHAADGSGYMLLADSIIGLDALNPQIGAHLARLRPLEKVRCKSTDYAARPCSACATQLIQRYYRGSDASAGVAKAQVESKRQFEVLFSRVC
jgi:hypothetical protein